MGCTQTIVTMKKLTDRLGVKGQRQKCLKCNLSLEFVTQDKEALFYQDKKYFQSITAMIENKEQKYTVVWNVTWEFLNKLNLIENCQQCLKSQWYYTQKKPVKQSILSTIVRKD